MSDQLLAREGPLGHVWLAANYDKKLTKQQLLGTSIEASSTLISKTPISNWTTSYTQDDKGTITLRLSGQLLLGIVRIYSRKTKYLLEDMNDILLRLKNSFKYVIGDSFIGEKALVNVAPQQTTVSNINTIMLSDQVTGMDLLYQDDLDLDQIPSKNLFDQNENENNGDSSFTFDQSIEFPRYTEDNDNQNVTGNDLELELDFDLEDDVNANESNDDSVELGRNASNIPDNPEISILDDLKMADHDLDFDFDIPLEGSEDQDNNSDEPAEPVTPEIVPQPVPQSRTRRTGVTEDGQLITNKRKLKIDLPEEMEGISVQTLKQNQQILVNGSQYITVPLSEKDKMLLIYELAMPIPKKRKTWNIDNQLKQACFDLSREEEEQLEEQHQLQFNELDEYNEDVSFDLSLPGLEETDVLQTDLEAPPIQHESSQHGNGTELTTQVAQELRSIFFEKEVASLSEVISKDLSINESDVEKHPLGIVNKTNGGEIINNRKEATKCFFELLVLASHDCVSLSQTSKGNTEIGGEICIQPRDRIHSFFL